MLPILTLARSFSRLIVALGGRGIIAPKLELGGIALVADIAYSMAQRFQTVSGTQTAVAVGAAQRLIITDPGFYEIWGQVANFDAHVAVARWSLRIEDESGTVLWLQHWTLGTAAADNTRFLPVRLFLGLNYSVSLTLGDALGALERVFTSIQLIHRLQE